MTIHSFVLIVSFVKSNDNQKINTQNIKIQKTMVITTLNWAGKTHKRATKKIILQEYHK